VAADSKYAAAHAARSRALTVIANNHARHDEIRPLYQRSIAAARDAIRLAPELAEGHSALGFVLFNGQLDARAARGPYQKSFELGFGNADILSAYANYAARIGEFADGRKAIARAQRLDPLNQTVFRNAGLLEFAARNYDAALSPLQTALSLNPKTSIAHSTLADIALLKGDYAAARTHYQQEPDPVNRQRGLAIAEMRLARPDRAYAALALLLRDHGDVSLYQQAQVLAQWGRKDDALTRLEKAVNAGDAGLVRMRNDPLLDPIRKTVRFAAVQRRLGFE
jgi:tetratricopeptide (TPR) repeat protein